MGKKKMSKEERKKFEAEKAEAIRIEMEKERFGIDWGTFYLIQFYFLNFLNLSYKFLFSVINWPQAASIGGRTKFETEAIVWCSWATKTWNPGE